MILVTGAGGFIGRHVCHLLVKQGYDVVAIDQHFVTPQPYPQLTGDICDTDFLAKIIQASTPDTIIHLAAVLNTASRSVLCAEGSGSSGLRVWSGPIRGDGSLTPDVLLDLLDLHGQGVLADNTHPGEMRSSEPSPPQLVAGPAARRLASAMELNHMDPDDLDHAAVQLHRRSR